MNPELYREYPDPNEPAGLARLLEITMRTLKKKYVTGPQLRDTHAKGLAVVRGVFTVPADLPADLRVGLFATPKSYPCVIRFSNTDPNPKADIEKDMRAISIKLMGVEGKMLWQDEPDAKTLDLLLMTAQTFITDDLSTFCDLQEALLAAYMEGFVGNLKLIWFFITNPSTARRVIKSEIHCANLLEMPYWSETAYAFGEKAAQYKLIPHKKATSTLPGDGAPFNYLNQRLSEDLAAGEVSFDFMVVLQTDPVKMPIEDSGVAWDETVSVPRKVATLTLPKQAIDEPALFSTGENLAFNAWRTLPDHKPLGWTNRVRLQIYTAVSEFRHKRNAQPIREPRE